MHIHFVCEKNKKDRVRDIRFTYSARQKYLAGTKHPGQPKYNGVWKWISHICRATNYVTSDFGMMTSSAPKEIDSHLPITIFFCVV